jgi:PhnB protein
MTKWTLATHIKDLTPQEFQEGVKAFFAKMARK